MLRSMYSGVSGLGAHQEKMDVIGNNISNVNTVGFKGSRVTFQEMLSQTMSGSVAPADGRGGLNPMQIGLGVSTSSIDNNMQTGNLQATGRDSDVAIQGDGFFVVNDGSQNVYTRAGNFAFDSEGYLVNTSTGYRVQGWLADDGEITSDSVQNLEDITLDRSMDPEESTRVSFDGNLDAGKANSFDIDSRFRVEEGGETDALSVEYEPVGGTYNRWQFTLDAENSTFDSTGDNEFTGYIELDKDGNITALENENGDDISEGSDDDPVLNINDSGETVTLETLAEGDNINDNPLFVSNGTNSEEVEANYELMARRTISTDVFDSQGNKHTVTLNAEKTDYNTWVIEEDEVEVEGSLEPADGWFGNEEEYTLHFGESGNLLDAGNTDFSLNYEPEGEMGEHELELVFDEVTQFSGDMTANFKNVDGYAAVLLWREYSRRGSVDALETLLAYNMEDTVNLEELARRAYNQMVRLTPFGDNLLPLPPKRPPIPFQPSRRCLEKVRLHCGRRFWG